MKKVAVLLGFVAFLAVSCEMKEPEPQVSDVSDISFTPCQQTKAAQQNELSDRVDVMFTHEGVQITHYNFEVTCDFTTVNVTHTFVNGVLNITQQGSPNQAKCICYTDVSYTINGMSQNEVNVIFINGVQVYCYNDGGKPYEEQGVYVSLHESPNNSNSSVPKLWKDGVLTNLTNNTGRAYVSSVYVFDKNVYIGGCKDAFIPFGDGIYVVPYAVIWKNGEEQFIGSDFSQITSVFVSGDDVYAAGNEYLIQNSGTLRKAGFLPFEQNFIYFFNYTYQLPEATAIGIKSSSLDAQRQSVATVWKNGEVEYLTDGTYFSLANSVYVSGSDVFVAGWERNKQNVYVAKLWKNGVVQNLTDGIRDGFASSVFVSGNDLYVAGHETKEGRNVAILWKNGVAQYLTGNSSLSASATSVFVSGNDVYITGMEDNSQSTRVAKLWKNGQAQILSDNGTQAHSVYVSGNDVYVAGFGQQNNNNYVAILWKNGVAQSLTDGSKNGFANSVFVK